MGLVLSQEARYLLLHKAVRFKNSRVVITASTVCAQLTHELMKRLKQEIVRSVNRVLRHTELFAEVDDCKRRLETTIRLQYLLTPRVLPLSNQASRIFQSINVDTIHADTNLEISKDDLMFLFWLHQTGSVEGALSGYFQSGLTQISVVSKLLERQFADPASITILDFASGHGRLSRYLKNVLPANRVLIADIKENAVSYQRDAFGYAGFTAPANPFDMTYEGEFDYILVSSLFTHLNKDLFSEWLTALGKMLKTNGVLSISLHILHTDSDSFQYVERSEDDLFPQTSDSLSGKNIYGLTHLSRSSFVGILEKSVGPKWKIIDEQDWAGSQVLFTVRKTDR
jgi:SAM-dependent methyltransferase